MPRLLGSSSRWVLRQNKDEYVKQAQKDGLASRAAFKLTEIDAKFHFVQPRRGARLLDLGASPGGFSQMAMRSFAPRLLCSVDLKPLAFSALGDEHHILTGDANDAAIHRRIEELLARTVTAEIPRPLFDVVLSDLSPAVSGIVITDAARATECVQIASTLCAKFLRNDGSLLAKFRMAGEAKSDVEALLKRDGFNRLRFTKPPSSRAESQEIFVLADQFRRRP
jgi:23S rRNA (uridine2552-2'-O)-methyltransferase